MQWNNSLLVVINFHHAYTVLNQTVKTVFLALINYQVLKAVRISVNELLQVQIC